MAKRNPTKHAVLLKLTPEILDLVDEKCDQSPELFQAGGRAGFITNLVYAHFGKPVPLNPRTIPMPKPMIPVEHIVEECLDDVSKLIVALAKAGRTLHEIVRYLNAEEIPHPGRGAGWYPMQIQRLLTDAVGRSLAYLKKEAPAARG